MAKLLGVDVGTSGCKAILIDETGAVLEQASAEYPISYLHPMWSEQDPEDWWRGVQTCISQIGERRPDAIGLTGQMHGAVFLDSERRVVRPAILWNDQRTVEQCRQIESLVGRERLMEITCNPMLTGFQAPKMLWLREHEPVNYARTRHLLLPKDFIRLRLTQALGADVSDASGTGLFDVPQRRWSGALMAELDLSPGILPPCFESADVSAETESNEAILEDGIPVVAGAGDQAAAAVGTGAVAPGIVSVSLGTSGVVFTALDEPSYDSRGAAHTFCHANGKWHAMGVMLSCGGALKWFRDTISSANSYDEIAADAALAPPGAAGVTFLPYLSGERCPHNDPFAKSAFAGLALHHDRSNLSRAVFEGASFGLLDCMKLLLDLGAQANEVRMTSGGSRSEFWMQLLADVFETPCTRLESDEGPAFGAALLAGTGIGVWPDIQSACQVAVRKKATIAPSGADYAGPYRRYRELYEATRAWNLI